MKRCHGMCAYTIDGNRKSGFKRYGKEVNLVPYGKMMK